MERVDQWRFLIPCIEPSRIGSMGQEENQNQPRIWQKTFAACLLHTKVPYALCGDYKALRLESLHTWHPQIPKIKKNWMLEFYEEKSRIDPCIHKRPQMYAHTRRQIYIYIHDIATIYAYLHTNVCLTSWMDRGLAAEVGMMGCLQHISLCGRFGSVSDPSCATC